jgi:GWxTD domain-containing protein
MHPALNSESALASPAAGRSFMKQILVCLLCVLWIAGLGVTSSGQTDALPTDHTLWPEFVFDAAYRLIAGRAEVQVLDTVPAGALPRYLELFWKRRDPSPATEINEFKEQFEARVATALARYRTYARPAPWDRRGEVYIRLGPPDEIVDSSFEAFYEKWYYFDRNLKLMFEGTDLEYDYLPFVEFSGEVQPQADYADDLDQVESTLVVYTLPPGVESVDLALDWYPFRRADGRYDVYVACALPLRSMARQTEWRKTDVSYSARVVVFDSTLRRTWSDSAQVQKTFDRIPRGALAQNQWQAILDPGLYVLTAEVNDARGKKHAVGAMDRWLVPFGDTVKLDLSALVVAADVREEGEDSGPFVRNGKEIVPMPGHVFADDQDVAFYHEVYNLTPDSGGLCHFMIEYALYDSIKRQRRTLISQELTSAERETFQAGTIAHHNIGPGRYILEATTTDLVGGQKKTALSAFKVD